MRLPEAESGMELLAAWLQGHPSDLSQAIHAAVNAPVVKAGEPGKIVDALLFASYDGVRVKFWDALDSVDPFLRADVADVGSTEFFTEICCAYHKAVTEQYIPYVARMEQAIETLSVELSPAEHSELMANIGECMLGSRAEYFLLVLEYVHEICFAYKMLQSDVRYALTNANTTATPRNVLDVSKSPAELSRMLHSAARHYQETSDTFEADQANTTCSSNGDSSHPYDDAFETLTAVSESLSPISMEDLLRVLRTPGLDRFGDNIVIDVAHRRVRSHVRKVCVKCFDTPYIPGLRKWFRRVVGPWLESSLSSNVQLTAIQQKRLKGRLEYHVFEQMGMLRIEEIFDIIVDYPDSLCAIKELSSCLRKTAQHPLLVKTLRAELMHRLLHAGASTNDIITQYISLVKVMQTLDPTGLTLHHVAEPVRAYLREHRPDTIRCLVSSIVDDTDSEIFQELARSSGSKPRSISETVLGGSDAVELFAEDDYGTGAGGHGGRRDDPFANGVAIYDRWHPLPAAASTTARDPRYARLAATAEREGTEVDDSGLEGPVSVDIIGMLISIYGSNDMFISQFCQLLGERLLQLTDFNTEQEVRTIELLKLRFGENALHNCEIMVKDFADSRRQDTLIHTQSDSTADGGVLAHAPLHSVVLSRNCWPGKLLPDVGAGAAAAQSADAGDGGGDLKLHPETQRWLDAYAAEFARLKQPRQLRWMRSLGVVDVSLEFEDGRMWSKTVTPLVATVVQHMGERGSCAVSELSAVVGVDENTLRRRSAVLLHECVLHESTDDSGKAVWNVVEHLDSVAAPPASGIGAIDDDAHEPGGVDDFDQELMVYEQYISGMLTNFDGLTMERIHNMLKMFVDDPPYERSLDELEALLHHLVNEEKLEVSHGAEPLYRLKK